ncbi:MAG TPA: BON domain-containing protein [Blastocatellia bacterium]|nr:BON domain-containing protein [Blastocatellia bacterium]
MRRFQKTLIALVAMLALAVSVASAGSEQGLGDASINREIRKQILTLPYYGVFDNIAYSLEGTTVRLSGQVVRPITRHDAGRRVARVKGVDRVVNDIEVLPLSNFDDSIRVRTYRAVFGTAGLSRYSIGANPAMRIIVNKGRVTLEGVVLNKTDKQLAFMAANGVSGVFAVTNNLRVEREN